MFQLTKEEWISFTKSVQIATSNKTQNDSIQDDYNLRSQIVTARFSDNWGGNRTLPYAFTEIGVAMLSSVLKSEVAIEANRKIMKTFIAYRHLAELPLAATYLDLRKQIEDLKSEVNDILADQNDINESTRAQLDAISTALAASALPLAANETQELQSSRCQNGTLNKRRPHRLYPTQGRRR